MGTLNIDSKLPVINGMGLMYGWMDRNKMIEEILNIEIKNCPVCGQPLKKRNGRFGEFWGCTGFPTCRHTENI